MITTIIIFIIILGILVFVHEFGHFYAAKKSGMKVEEFGFGFPPRVFGLQRVDGRFKIIWGHKTPADPDKTVYSVNAIPLGGFVRILGENNEAQDDPRSFINRPFWGRLITLVAGVTMNVVLAWVLFSVGFMVGLPSVVDSANDIPANSRLKDLQVAIMEVREGQPADRAGLMAGDMIQSINGESFGGVMDTEDAQNYIMAHQGELLNFSVQRVNETMDISVQSNPNPGPDEGPTGIALANIGKISFPWYLAFWEGARATVNQLTNIVTGLYQLLTSKIGLQSLGGPVKIAQLTGQVADLGFIYLLQFTAFLSLNLAILNILPFPALDGGRVVFLLVEKIRGRKNNQRLEQWVNTVGFLLLLSLMLLVTIKDVRSF